MVHAQFSLDSSLGSSSGMEMVQPSSGKLGGRRSLVNINESRSAEEDAGWQDTHTLDTARDKAMASHETMGLVSALLAGFELAALVEVDLADCNIDDTDCTGAEGGFVITASYCVGLSTIVVLETSFEYMFVMRELHHGNESAWNLIKAFRYCRRVAECFFALEIIMFLASVGLLVHVRFARLLPTATSLAQALLIINFALIFVLVAMMQRAKVTHGEGKKLKRKEAEERRRRRREEADMRRTGLSDKGFDKTKRKSAMFTSSLKRLSVRPFAAVDGLGGRGSTGLLSSSGGPSSSQPWSGRDVLQAKMPLQRAKTAPSLGPSGREEVGSDERGDGEGDGDSVTPNQVGGDEAIVLSSSSGVAEEQPSAQAHSASSALLEGRAEDI